MLCVSDYLFYKFSSLRGTLRNMIPAATGLRRLPNISNTSLLYVFHSVIKTYLTNIHYTE